MTSPDLTPQLTAPPRAVRLRRGYRVARVLLPLLAIALPMAFCLGAHFEARSLQRLADGGVVVQGHVTDLRRQHGSKGSPSYYAVYSFSVGTRQVIGSTQLPRAAWERLAPGAEVPVCYWPTDPEVNRIGAVTQGDVERKLRTGWLSAGLALAMLGGFAALLERVLRRKLGLLRDGRACAGQVVDYQGFRSRKKKDRLAFRFRPPAGAEVERVDRLRRKLQPAPAPGTDIVVLQSRTDPAVFATLPCLLEYVELPE